MLTWILLAIGVLLINIYLPALLYFPSVGVARHVGSRDVLPEPGTHVLRARRALANMQENFPIFAVLAVLALVVEGTDMDQAILGAQLFVVGRAIYIPMYMISVPWTRSAAFTIAFAGQILMFLALL